MRAIFDEFVPAYYTHVADTARTWLAQILVDFRARIVEEVRNGANVASSAALMLDIGILEDDLQHILSPF
jgi:hypothetical protein